MQLKWMGAALVALVAFGQTSALAAGGTKDKGSSGFGGGEGGGAGGGGGSEPEPGAEAGFERRPSVEKSWELEGAVEYHHLLQADFAPGTATPISPTTAPGASPGSPDSGNALNRNAMYYDITGYWEPTPVDRIWAEWGFIQRFIKNPGEDTCPSTGPDDGIIAYRRSIFLPERVVVRVQPRVDVGLSCESIRYESLVAAPRLGVSAEREFGPVFVSLETHGYAYLTKYTSYTSPNTTLGGGQATPEASLHAVLRSRVTMPFYKPVSVGVLATVSTTWYHQVQGSNASLMANGSTSDPLVPNQPFTNSAGWEIYARYTFPTVRGVGSDLEVAYADGDPSITGYQSLMHDNGHASFNLFYRSVSEVYTALTVFY